MINNRENKKHIDFGDNRETQFIILLILNNVMILFERYVSEITDISISIIELMDYIFNIFQFDDKYMWYINHLLGNKPLTYDNKSIIINIQNTLKIVNVSIEYCNLLEHFLNENQQIYKACCHPTSKKCKHNITMYIYLKIGSIKLIKQFYPNKSNCIKYIEKHPEIYPSRIINYLYE